MYIRQQNDNYILCLVLEITERSTVTFRLETSQWYEIKRKEAHRPALFHVFITFFVLGEDSTYKTVVTSVRYNLTVKNGET